MYSNPSSLPYSAHNIPGVSSNSGKLISTLPPPGVNTAGSAPSTVMNMPPGVSTSSAQLPPPPPRNRLKIRLAPQTVAPPFYLMSPQSQQLAISLDDNPHASNHLTSDQLSSQSHSQVVTGWNNLIQHENLEPSYHKFCGSWRRVQSDLSGFLTGIAADVNLPASEDGGSLRSLIERPPIPRTIVPLQPSHSEVAFRLHTGRLPPKYMELFASISNSSNPMSGGMNNMTHDDSESGNDMTAAGATRNGKVRRKSRKDVLRDIPSSANVNMVSSGHGSMLADASGGLPHVSSASMLSAGPMKSLGSGSIPGTRPVSTPLQVGAAMTPINVPSIHSTASITEISKKSRRSNDDEERRKRKKKEKKRKRDKD